MNICEILRKHAGARPNTPAIIHRRTLTFAELERESAQFAALLHTAGLRAGEAVLVFQPMSAELYVVLLAVFRLGLTAMFLDPSAGRAHIEQCCALNPPQALIASAKAHCLRLISPALRRIPQKFVTGLAIKRAARLAPLAAVEPCAEDAAALLTFTSGSTGAPKAALRTHGFLLAQHRVLERSLALRAGEIDLTTLPVFVLANLASGVTSLIPDADLRRPGAIAPAPVVAQLNKHRPASTAASPALLERIADHCLRADVRLESLRRIHTGGAPVFPRVLDKLQAVAPQAEVVAVYGSTEAEPIAHLARREITNNDAALMRSGGGLPAGEAVPEIELRILRDQWGTPLGPCTTNEFVAACVPAGEAGEIVVSGAHVLPGYWLGKGNEETKFKVDGATWHRTGDAGYVDATGRLWLLGRCAARVADERGVLYPFAVECAAHQFEAVRRTALVAEHGKRVLVVESARAMTAAEWQAMRNALAWARLDEIRVLKRIPTDKRHNAKVDYPALRAMLAG